MHIQKLLAMISVGAIFGAGSLQAQSADSDFQAKAREAMRQKMADLNAPNTPPAPVVPAAPAPVMPAYPAVSTPPPAAAVPAEPVYPTPVAPAAPVMPVTPAAPIAPVELPKPATKEFEATGTLPPAAVMETSPRQTASPDLQSRAIEALRQKKAELDAQDQAAAHSAAAMKTPPAQMDGTFAPTPAYMPPPKHNPAPMTSPVVVAPQPAPPYVAPPTMLSGSKEQRLAELLQLYKTDRITPTEYHQQRAKVLSEP